MGSRVRAVSLRPALAAALALTIALAACSSPTSPGNHLLRVSNVGTSTIEGLTVLFPSETVSLGSVPASSTSTYTPVSRGVYAYGAFRFVVDGVVVQQPVIDWVGEEPLEGDFFTYSLELITQGGRPFLRITRVDRDK